MGDSDDKQASDEFTADRERNDREKSAPDPILNNPYEALDLPSSMAPRELTAVLRERVEGLPPVERAEVRGAWEALTVNDRQRARYALFARMRLESAGARGRLQALSRAIRSPSTEDTPVAAEMVGELGARDLLVPPQGLPGEPPVFHDHGSTVSLSEDPFFELEPQDDMD